MKILRIFPFEENQDGRLVQRVQLHEKSVELSTQRKGVQGFFLLHVLGSSGLELQCFETSPWGTFICDPFTFYLVLFFLHLFIQHLLLSFRQVLNINLGFLFYLSRLVFKHLSILWSMIM